MGTCRLVSDIIASILRLITSALLATVSITENSTLQLSTSVGIGLERLATLATQRADANGVQAARRHPRHQEHPLQRRLLPVLERGGGRRHRRSVVRVPRAEINTQGNCRADVVVVDLWVTMQGPRT